MLAQVAPVTSSLVGGVLDTADRVGTMSAAGVGALIVIVSLVFAYWQMNQRAAAEKRTAELLEKRADKSEADMAARLLEQKADATASKAEVLALARESDETLSMALKVMGSLEAENGRLRVELGQLREELARFRAQAERVERALVSKGA